MKVSELIKELQKMDQEKQVYYEVGESAAPVTRISDLGNMGVLLVYGGSYSFEQDE